MNKKDRDFIIFLEDILESIEKIGRYTDNLTEADFSRNEQCQDAVIKRFEIIGEATKKIPADFKRKHPEISWKNLADTRDFFIHEYFDINKHRLWIAIIKESPELKKKIGIILEELKIKKLDF